MTNINLNSKMYIEINIQFKRSNFKTSTIMNIWRKFYKKCKLVLIFKNT